MLFLRKYVGDKMGEIKIVKSAINNEGQKLCEDSEKIMDIKRRLESFISMGRRRLKKFH